VEKTDDLRGLKLSLAVYVLVFGLKLGVWFVSGAMALLAEALHTLSDIFISGFLLAATLLARKDPDATHRFGHGRAQNVAALVAATLFISFTSLKLYEEAIPRLFRHDAVEHRNLGLVLAVLGFSMLVAAAPLVTMLRSRARGAAAKAQVMELVNDELGLVAALVGTLFVMSGHPLADPLAAIVVATIIAANAAGIFRENASYLLGRSPEPEYLRAIEEAARAVPGVIGVENLRAEYIGPDSVHAGMHLLVDPQITVREADRIAEQVRERVSPCGGKGHCFIHVDPAPPAAG
jgi:cation diffusion facilitator family transporter